MRKNPLFWVLSISAALFVVFLAFAVIGLSTFKPGPAPGRIFQGSGVLGVLEIEGAILDAKKILEKLGDLVEDKGVRGILVRLNSPGGAVGPSQEIHEALRAAAEKKPVFASMGAVAASGAYYIAVGTQRIFANPGTMTGSIGVIMQFADMSRLYDWAKVSPYNLKTGKYKDTGSPFRPMTAEERQLMQSMIDNVLGQFRKAVAMGRKLPMEKVVELSDGRIYSGEQARLAKLVDDLGGFEAAVKALAEAAKIKGKPVLVYPRKGRGRLLELILGEDDDSGASESLGASSPAGSLGSAALRLIASGLGGLDGAGTASRGSGSTSLHGPLFLLPSALPR